MTINQISKNFRSGIIPWQITTNIYNILLLKLIKLKMVSLLLLWTFFNLAKILPLNLEVIISRTNIQTVHFGSESIKTLGAKLLDLIPAEIKASKSLMTFKKKIKNCTPKSCPCRLCRVYIGQVGFTFTLLSSLTTC